MTNLKNLFKSIILSACVMIACLTCEDTHHDPPQPKPITFEKVISLNPEWTHYVAGGQVTSDGGYIVAGRVFEYATFTEKIFLIKTDAYGEMLWNKLYYYQAPNGVIACGAGSVAQTNDGGYIIGGSAITNRNGLGDNDIYLIKTDANGDTVWTKTFDRTKSDGASEVRQTVDGGYIVCGGIAGYTPEFGEGGIQTYIIKTNSVGDTLWTRTFENYFGTYFNGNSSRSVVPSQDGSFVLTGNSGLGIHLIKLSSSGDVQSFQVYGGNEAYDVKETKGGGIVIAGGLVPQGSLYGDAYLIKTDVTGNIEWSGHWGGEFSDRAHSVCQTSDSGFAVAGFTDINYVQTKSDVFLVKVNSAGDTLWTRVFGKESYDAAASVHQTSDEGYILIGRSEDQSGYQYVYLIKTDSLGNVYAPDP